MLHSLRQESPETPPRWVPRLCFQFTLFPFTMVILCTYARFLCPAKSFLSSSCLTSLSLKPLSLLCSPQMVFVFLFIHLNIAIFSGLSQPYWSSTGINSSQRTQNNQVRISVTCTEPAAKQGLVFCSERDTIKTSCSGLHFHFVYKLSYVLG